MDHNKTQEQKFQDWTRKTVIEIYETITKLAMEFDRQIKELKTVKEIRGMEIKKAKTIKKKSV